LEEAAQTCYPLPLKSAIQDELDQLIELVPSVLGLQDASSSALCQARPKLERAALWSPNAGLVDSLHRPLAVDGWNMRLPATVDLIAAIGQAP